MEETKKKIVKNYTWYSMGAGLIPVPFVDMAAITGVQLKMVKDIAQDYDVDFSENRGKSIISGLIGSIVPSSLASSSLMYIKHIPVVGSIVGGLSLSLFAGAATYAMGHVFIQHFESGGNLLNFDSDAMNDYFKAKFAEGQDVAKDMKKNKNK